MVDCESGVRSLILARHTLNTIKELVSLSMHIPEPSALILFVQKPCRGGVLFPQVFTLCRIDDGLSTCSIILR